MNRIVTFAVPTLLFLAHAAFANPHTSTVPVDSIGVQRKDGRRFVLHRVDQGQTLYAVSRRYGVTVAAIKAANPELTDNLRYDQLLRVPVSDPLLVRRVQAEVEKLTKKNETDRAKTARETSQPTGSETDVTARTDPKSQAKTDKPAEKTARTTATSTKGNHVVEDGQTLYGLAARYRVSMADLRRWNDLSVDGIQGGQTLIVSEKAYEAKRVGDAPVLSAGVAKAKPAPVKDIEPETVKSEPIKSEPIRNEPVKSEPARSEPVESEPARSEPVRNEPTENVLVRSQPVKLEAKPIITPAPLPTPGTKPAPKPAETKPAEAKPTEAKLVETKPEVKRTEPKAIKPKADNEPVASTRKANANIKSDIGFAEMIEGNDASTKYLALHRSAPIGTLVQVRNDITNQSLYVKVIGKLPDTGINNDILIRLSGRAFEKLSPNGQRFRAEVSYSN